MSHWNNRIKYFAQSKVKKLEHLYYVIGAEGWGAFNCEVILKTDNRIERVYTDCISGAINTINGYVSEEQFNEDCKLVNKMLKELEKKCLQNK